MEEALLGGMMRHSGTVSEVLQILRREDFHWEPNRVVFSAMLALSNSNIPIDVVILAHALCRDGELEQAGGYSRLAQLFGSACPDNQMLPLAQQLRNRENR
jgi:replicative DNA helicase